ncbi:MAG: hypothetical protein WBM15_14155 [Chromatiaceae bacterium]
MDVRREVSLAEAKARITLFATSKLPCACRYVESERRDPGQGKFGP